VERAPDQFVSTDADRIQTADAASPPMPEDAQSNASSYDGYGVSCDLPRALPVMREEVTLLRAFLGAELEAILFGDEA
jgi:hypothetical protein